MKKNMQDYFDSRGWIGHFKKDESGTPIRNNGKYELEFGDSLQRTSMNCIFNWVGALNSPMDRAAIKASFWRKSFDIWLPSGEPVRHWSRLEWYGKSGTMSGDQIEPYLWASVMFDLPDVFWPMFKKLFKRGFLAWNTKRIGQTDEKTKLPDFIGLRVVSPMLRMLMKESAFTALLLYIPLIFWDLIWTGLNSIIRVVTPLFDRENTGDDINFVCSLVGSKICFDNPAAWFWRKFYLIARPEARIKNNLSFNANQRGYLGPQTAFNQYFHELAAPPLNDKAWAVIVWL